MDMDVRRWTAIAVCIGSACVMPVHAAMYKWVDANGRVVYSDQPPAGAKAEKINPSVAPADMNAVRDLANKDMDLKKRQQARADDVAKAEKADTETKQRLDQCTQARGRIRTLQMETNVYRYSPTGEKVYMEPAERQKALGDNDKILRDLNCP